jgi:hypothetical protein
MTENQPGRIIQEEIGAGPLHPILERQGKIIYNFTV